MQIIGFLSFPKLWGFIKQSTNAFNSRIPLNINILPRDGQRDQGCWFFFLLFWCLVVLMYEQLISSDQAGA